MCGVIGLVFEERRDDLGRIAAELLEMLEYRGYDSTGAAIQDEGTSITLRKGVGAPSVMVHELGIVGLSGQIMAGQVRWATFGAVDQKNSQPHEVRCKIHIYGAHNGNVTNSDDQKLWLVSQGHQVLSDNDGEMVVHTIEHAFAARVKDDMSTLDRRAAMRAAIVEAATRLKGSFAAVIVDPVTRAAWAIKLGSSLYFGVGKDEAGRRFTLASSDLSSVLKLTRMVVPISEGDFVEHDGATWAAYSVRAKGGASAGARLDKTAKKSRLRAKDTALSPGFATFMEQEIHAQVKTVRDVVTSFLGGSSMFRALVESIDQAAFEELRDRVDELVDLQGPMRQRPALEALAAHPAVKAALASLPEGQLASLRAGPLADSLLSSASSSFLELEAQVPDRALLALLDATLARDELEEVERAVRGFCALVTATLAKGRHVYVVSCGSSFHAAKAGAVFFDELARAPIFPVLPGEFRGQYAETLEDGDLVVAVSQSGETKDLVDVMTLVLASGKKVARVGLVNNVSSTLGQEQSDLVIPLRCGPEIAVPATKSFMNQMAVFYGLALRVAEARAVDPGVGEGVRASIATDLEERRRRFLALPELIKRTIAETKPAVEDAAEQLYRAPSLHILSTRVAAIAKEGALKIREVVLNHTEGFEASEFKHGPNTILGKSTVYGTDQLRALFSAFAELLDGLPAGVDGAAFARSSALALFDPSARTLGSAERAKLLDALDVPYPLVYVTGPNARDVDLTISQINTHKIRGSKTIVIAEEDAALRQAATKPPADNPAYVSRFVVLPKTGDTLSAAFSATVVLQLLALAMSMKKLSYLDALGFRGHGVHPDVPKNVSKSITVD
ncbi:MAG: SIS domain-containing protein [Deltaproteobacteria bacterium]|nr:SIS domain-containing protein [Deltaproteobacteria bacterium]